MRATGKPKRLLPFLKSTEERKLLHVARPMSVEAEDLVFDQSTTLRAIYFIIDGSIRIEREDDGQVLLLAVLGSGEFFGEMSFVDGAPTSARAVAQEPTALHVIRASDVDKLGKLDPSFTGRFYRSLAAILVQRLRRTSSLLSFDNRAA
jgi:CRP-like cAMP-binding protein